MLANIDGYKMIYFTENLLRDFVEEILPEGSFPSNYKKDAIENAKANGFEELTSYRNILEFLHLGQLVSIINSSLFQNLKTTNSNRVNIGPLISRRNTIMHSRSIGGDKIDEIQSLCTRVIQSLCDGHYMVKWERFISQEIINYSIPQVFIEYPLGKNFDKLIGRDEELKELKYWIQNPMPTSIIGHGGLGKTALVLQIIEDFMYSPRQPFEKIYFMSFKNTVFENGTIQRFEKVISNHDDLINRLATFMGIEIAGRPFSDVEEDVWSEMFSRKSLLILDNLETEIVRSNLTEFTQIADRFIKNFMHPSRLIITSRYGMGDRERKYPLHEFQLEKTKVFVKLHVYKVEKLKGVYKEDWDWIQRYTQGNAGLIISFSNTFNSTNKSIADLRVEYQTKYTEISRELHNKLDTFLEFCFENTIESMPKESQIFLSCLCYLCLETNLHELSEGFLSFLVDELKLTKLGEQNLRALNYVNIGFLQPITGTDRYYANELVTEYMNGNYSNNNVFSVFNLKSSEWYPHLVSISNSIKAIQFDEEHSLGQIIAKLYREKFRISSDNIYLLKAFLLSPSIEALIEYYKNSDEVQILNNLILLDKIKTLLMTSRTKREQQFIVKKILSAIDQINQLIMQDKAPVNFRQRNLVEYFNQIQNKFYILKERDLDLKLRTQVCELLISLNKPDVAEAYLTENIFNTPLIAFKIYSKLVGDLARKDEKRCEEYMSRSKLILKNHMQEISITEQAKFYIYCARFLSQRNPQEAYSILGLLDATNKGLPISVYPLFLESLLIKAECLISMKKPLNQIEEVVNKFRQEKDTTRYQKQLFPKKKDSLERTLERIERTIVRRKAN